jgi:hypothetical protein
VLVSDFINLPLEAFRLLLIVLIFVDCVDLLIFEKYVKCYGCGGNCVFVLAPIFALSACHLHGCI